MHVASVRFVTPDGASHDLFVGDVVGRVWHAALQILDPRISGFHACIALREGQLVLLPLRGRLRLGGIGVQAVRLEPGLRIELVAGFALEVVSLHMPERLPALCIDGGEPQVLERTACSVVQGVLVPGLREASEARVWTDGDRWYVQSDAGSHAIEAGSRTEVSGRALRFVLVAADQAGIEATVGRAQTPPLHLVVRYDTVHFHETGGEVTTLSGLPARLVSELAQLGGPAHWEIVARELWRSGIDRAALRARWDKTLRTLRRKLQAARLPEGLVHTGGGYCELVLRPHDTVDVQL